MDLFCEYYNFKEEGMSKIKVNKVEALCVMPGDIVIFKSPELITKTNVESLRAALEDEFPNNKVLILDGGCDLGVVREGVDSDADTDS